MSFFAIPTLAGQAAIAAAIANDEPLDLQSMVVGDGGGTATGPVETQTGLVNLRATVAIQSAARDANKVTVDAILDENTGGFIIREAGLVDGDGVLLFVASIPETEKQTLAQGVFDVLTLGLIIVVSDTAQITIGVTDGAWATQDYVNTQLENWRTHIAQPLRPYFIAIDGLTSTVPSVPAVGATYIVGVGASGLWFGQDHKLAQYRGNVGWVFAVAPLGTMVAVTVDGQMTYSRRTSTGWRPIMASLLEHLAASSTNLFTNPAGVAAMIAGFFPADEDGVLANDGAGALAWVPRLDIAGLTAKASASDSDAIPVYAGAPINGNRQITVAAIAAKVVDSDAFHSEMFFLGMT